MQKRRRFGGIRHNFLQFPLAIVRGYHPGVDLGRSTALEDQVHEDVAIAVDLLDLDLGRLDRRSPPMRWRFISRVNSPQNSLNRAGSIR